MSQTLKPEAAEKLEMKEQEERENARLQDEKRLSKNEEKGSNGYWHYTPDCDDYMCVMQRNWRKEEKIIQKVSKYKEKDRANFQVPVKMPAYEKSVQELMKEKKYWKNWDDEESHWTVCM